MEKFECNDSELIIGKSGYREFLDFTWRYYFSNDQLYNNVDVIRREFLSLSKYSFLKDFDLDVRALRIIKNYNQFKDRFYDFVKFVDKICISNSDQFEKATKNFQNLQLLGGGVGLTAHTVNSAYDAKRFIKNTSLTDSKLDELARDVYRGKYGSGNERIKRLNSLGYGDIYDKVQTRVNEKYYNVKTTSNGAKTVNTSINQSSDNTKSIVTKDGSESKIKDLTAKNNELEKNIGVKKEENDKLTKALNTEKEKSTNLNKELNSEKSKNESLNKDLTEAKEENSKLNEKIENNNKTIEEQRKTIFAKDSEIERLKEQTQENNNNNQTTLTPDVKPEAVPTQRPTQTVVTEIRPQTTTPSSDVPDNNNSSNTTVNTSINDSTSTTNPTVSSSSDSSSTSLPNPNAYSNNSSSANTSSGKGFNPVPLAVGLGAAVAGGIGIKAIHDHRENSKFNDQNEDSITNGNRFWTDEEPNVMHTEEDLFKDDSQEQDVSYQAVENNANIIDNSYDNDTWSIEENEIEDNNTFDLLSENN